MRFSRCCLPGTVAGLAPRHPPSSRATLRFARCGTALFVLSLAAPAGAQDVVTAEALFNRGLTDMQAGRYETGCPALAESHRLDPRLGRLFTLAECEAKRGRIATAMALYSDYLAQYARLPPAQQSKQLGREEIAAKQRGQLAPLVPQLSLSLPPGAPPGTIVKRDDAALGAATLGVPLPIDPGPHRVTTQAPGGPETEIRFTLEKGEKKQITLNVRAAPESEGAVNTTEMSGHSGPPPPPMDGRRVGGFVVGGLGLAGLAAGGALGALALGKQSTIKAECVDQGPGKALCSHAGKVAADSARSLELGSTIAFGVGGAAVVAGVVLLVVARGRPKSAPGPSVAVLSCGPQGAVFGLRGSL